MFNLFLLTSLYIGERDRQNRIERAARSLPADPTPEEIESAAEAAGPGVSKGDVDRRKGELDKPPEHYISSEKLYEPTPEQIEKYPKLERVRGTKEFVERKIKEAQPATRQEVAKKLFEKQRKKVTVSKPGEITVIDPSKPGRKTVITKPGDIVEVPVSAKVSPPFVRQMIRKRDIPTAGKPKKLMPRIQETFRKGYRSLFREKEEKVKLIEAPEWKEPPISEVQPAPKPPSLFQRLRHKESIQPGYGVVALPVSYAVMFGKGAVALFRPSTYKGLYQAARQPYKTFFAAGAAFGEELKLAPGAAIGGAVGYYKGARFTTKRIVGAVSERLPVTKTYTTRHPTGKITMTKLLRKGVETRKIKLEVIEKIVKAKKAPKLRVKPIDIKFTESIAERVPAGLRTITRAGKGKIVFRKLTARIGKIKYKSVSLKVEKVIGEKVRFSYEATKAGRLVSLQRELIPVDLKVAPIKTVYAPILIKAHTKTILPVISQKIIQKIKRFELVETIPKKPIKIKFPKTRFVSEKEIRKITKIPIGEAIPVGIYQHRTYAKIPLTKKLITKTPPKIYIKKGMSKISTAKYTQHERVHFLVAEKRLFTAETPYVKKQIIRSISQRFPTSDISEVYQTKSPDIIVGEKLAFSGSIGFLGAQKARARLERFFYPREYKLKRLPTTIKITPKKTGIPKDIKVSAHIRQRLIKKGDILFEEKIKRPEYKTPEITGFVTARQIPAPYVKKVGKVLKKGRPKVVDLKVKPREPGPDIAGYALQKGKLFTFEKLGREPVLKIKHLEVPERIPTARQIALQRFKEVPKQKAKPIISKRPIAVERKAAPQILLPVIAPKLITPSRVDISPVTRARPMVAARPIVDLKPITKARPITEIKPISEIKPITKIRPIIKSRPITEIKPVTKIRAVQKVRPIQKIRPIQKARPIDILTPPPPTPIIIPPPILEKKTFKPKKKFPAIRFKQPKRLTPTARAAAFGLKGKTIKIGIKTGLGERFVPNIPKLKIPGFFGGT